LVDGWIFWLIDSDDRLSRRQGTKNLIKNNEKKSNEKIDPKIKKPVLEELARFCYLEPKWLR